MSDKFNEWKSTVSNLNNSADEIISAREEAYKIMADAIKGGFRKSNNPVPRIHFESDASEIVCTWDMGVTPVIPVDLIVSIRMPFSFTKELNIDGEWERKLIFYPFRED